MVTLENFDFLVFVCFFWFMLHHKLLHNWWPPWVALWWLAIWWNPASCFQKIAISILFLKSLHTSLWNIDGHFSDHFYAAVATFGGRSGKEKFKVCCRSQFYIFFNNNFKFSRFPKIKRPLGHQGWLQIKILQCPPTLFKVVIRFYGNLEKSSILNFLNFFMVYLVAKWLQKFSGHHEWPFGGQHLNAILRKTWKKENSWILLNSHSIIGLSLLMAT